MIWLRRRIRPEQIRELILLLLIIVAIVSFGSLIDGYSSNRTFNRIASGVANYDEVTRLMLGVPLDAQSLPIARE